MGCTHSSADTELVPRGASITKSATSMTNSQYRRAGDTAKMNAVKVVPLEQLQLAGIENRATPTDNTTLSPHSLRDRDSYGRGSPTGERSSRNSRASLRHPSDLSGASLTESDDDLQRRHSERLARKAALQNNVRRVDDPGAVPGLKSVPSGQLKHLPSLRTRFSQQAAESDPSQQERALEPNVVPEASDSGEIASRESAESLKLVTRERSVSFHAVKVENKPDFSRGDPEEDLLEAQHQARLARKLSIQQSVKRLDDDGVVGRQEEARADEGLSVPPNRSMRWQMSKSFKVREDDEELANAEKKEDEAPAEDVPRNRMMKWQMSKSFKVVDGQEDDVSLEEGVPTRPELQRGESCHSMKRFVSFSAKAAVDGIEQEQRPIYTRLPSMQQRAPRQEREDRTSVRSDDSHEMIHDPYGQQAPMG